jgi:hypothetical protein
MSLPTADICITVLRSSTTTWAAPALELSAAALELLVTDVAGAAALFGELALLFCERTTANAAKAATATPPKTADSKTGFTFIAYVSLMN